MDPRTADAEGCGDLVRVAALVPGLRDTLAEIHRVGCRHGHLRREEYHDGGTMYKSKTL